MSSKSVFISYSHDSPEHSERVLQFANALRHHGIDAELDRYQVRPPKGWPHWCEAQLRPENSAFVLMVCTETYLKRIQDKVPADEGRGVFWEGGIIYDYIYDAKGDTRFIPVLFDSAHADFIPLPLRNHTRYRVDAFDLSDVGYQDLYRELTGQPLVIKPPLGEVVRLGVELAATATPLAARPVKTDFPAVDISRILKYAPAELIGRDDELELLNEAWTKVQNHEITRPRILTFVALGGEGKTSLVAKWAAELAAHDWPGCDAAFAWSFYSQGSSEQQAASSDLFLKEALTFFGDDKDKEFAASNAGAYEKGQRLARVVGAKRTLLTLDGLEPLQYAPTSPTPGELKDEGISALLKGLAQNSRGLCIVTTRYSLPDLRAFWQTTTPEKPLVRLSKEAGVHLLQQLGVRKESGSKAEFEKLVEDVKGHALTLTLLGSYLGEAHGGDIRKRDLVKLEEADTEIVVMTDHPNHAFHVMDAYGRWLETGGKNEEENKKGLRALALLRLLGLFDRPATADCLQALWTGEVIPNLTEPLVGLDHAQRNIALTRLEAAKLLTVNRDASGALGSLDAHPHLREYFAQQLRTRYPDSWRAAHRRLYEHLRDTTTHEGDQPTLEDLQPLYQAVAHGCHAGLQQEAYDDLYFARIRKGNEYYSVRRLGAYGADLGAVACFFDTPWSRLSPSIMENTQAKLLNAAASWLRALGRLTEALEPIRAGLKMGVEAKEWGAAAIRASNLSEVEQTLGEVAWAVEDASRSVTYADRSGDPFWKMGARTTHAGTLHQVGCRDEAETHFREAEQMQRERQPEYPLLYSVAGFAYCDLLLSAPERAVWRELNTQTTVGSGQKAESVGQKLELVERCRAVAERAAQTLNWAQEANLSPLTLALDHVTLGRAALYASILTNSMSETPHSELVQAVDGLRRAGTQDLLPGGLLTRAWLRFLEGARTGPESAQEDLDEAWEIAERGPMKLFMVDIYLYRARLFGGVKDEGGRMKYPWDKSPDGSMRGPKDDLDAAEKLINECGYHRRDEELADAKEAAKNW